jgi:hypothetical protein
LLVKLVKVVLTVAKSVLIAVMPHPDASGWGRQDWRSKIKKKN